MTNVPLPGMRRREESHSLLASITTYLATHPGPQPAAVIARALGYAHGEKYYDHVFADLSTLARQGRITRVWQGTYACLEPSARDAALPVRTFTELCALRGLSLPVLAARAGIHRATLTDIARGGTNPKQTTIRKLATVLKVTPMYLERLLGVVPNASEVTHA